jgi:hypothetical protein
MRDAVVGIAHGHVHAAHLGVHALGDGQAGGVVLGAVDAQPEDRRCIEVARGLARAQVALGVERHEVGVDGLGHGNTPYGSAVGSGGDSIRRGPEALSEGYGCRAGVLAG